nr:hypothetical protein [Tanacetum cinerariifolium]
IHRTKCTIPDVYSNYKDGTDFDRMNCLSMGFTGSAMAGGDVGTWFTAAVEIAVDVGDEVTPVAGASPSVFSSLFDLM